MTKTPTLRVSADLLDLKAAPPLPGPSLGVPEGLALVLLWCLVYTVPLLLAFRIAFSEETQRSLIKLPTIKKIKLTLSSSSSSTHNFNKSNATSSNATSKSLSVLPPYRA